jgi:hypothetical protein
MAEEIRRPGEYGVKTSTSSSTTSSATTSPATMPGVPPAPPLPPSAPVFDPRNPADQLAQEILNAAPPAATPEERLKQIEEARAKAKEYLSLTPAERWLRNIKNAGLTEAEANEILDKVLEQGYWEKEYALYNGRLKITLRSRDAAANQRVANALDEVRSFDQRVLDQARLRVQLACSLVRFRDKILPTAAPDEDPAKHEAAFRARLTFCDQYIAGPIVEAVYRALIDFDAKTYAALSEGAPAGF